MSSSPVACRRTSSFSASATSGSTTSSGRLIRFNSGVSLAMGNSQRILSELRSLCKQRQDHGACLIELRGQGLQTMVPPSIHPCGERLEWEEYGEPAKVDGNKLLDCVARSRLHPRRAALVSERKSPYCRIS